MIINYKEPFNKFVADVMADKQAAGMAVSVFNKNGSTLYENYFGYRDVENKISIDEDTIFGLASITKSFTCLSIMQLYEKGIIDIKQPVKTYIPEFTSRDGRITIEHLMIHSAGYYPLKRILVKDVAEELGLEEEFCEDFAYNEDIALEGAKQVIERLNSQRIFTGEPGEQFSYSNDCYALLSEIIRRYGGEKSYSAYLNKYILKPLGMERSGCDFIKVQKDRNTSLLYTVKQGKREASLDFYDNAFALMGGGAMKSTIRDMKAYVCMYLNKGKSVSREMIISRRGIENMERARQYYRSQSYYGYGLSTSFQDDLALIGHSGSLTGVSTAMLWSRELNIGVAVLCNTSGVDVTKVAESAMKMINEKDPVPQNEYKEAIPEDSLMKSLIGKYRSEEGHDLEFYLNENYKIKLKIDGNEQPFIITNQLTGIIKNKLTASRIEFIKGDNDEVIAVRYGGRIVPKLRV